MSTAMSRLSKPFSKFTLAQAYELLGIEQLTNWIAEITPIKPSEFFQQRLTRSSSLI
jgi:hypothetical protein